MGIGELHRAKALAVPHQAGRSWTVTLSFMPDNQLHQHLLPSSFAVNYSVTLKLAAKRASIQRFVTSSPMRNVRRAFACCKRRALEAGPGGVDEDSFQATFARRRRAGAHSHLGATCVVRA